MILSVSRRTDIPTYYSEWFMNRIREGSVVIRNPFRPTQMSPVSLDPAGVDAIVFWTRNGEPLTPYLDELDRMGYCYYFHYTVVHYPEVFEGSSDPLPQKLERFKRLSHRVGPERIIWRYDPIILSSLTDEEYHQFHFEEIARSLKGFSYRCVISFLDIYRKTEKILDSLKREKGIRVINMHHHEGKIREISRFLSNVGGECNFEIFTCAEAVRLEELGIRHGKCIDDDLLNRLFGLDLSRAKDKGQRKLCRCVESKDVGAYDTCPHGCFYCYANTSPELARKNFFRHNKYSPVLL